MNVCVGIKSAVFCYSRLATVYMAASDLFLNVEIRSLIKQCLVDILQSGRSLVFRATNLPGIDSFEVRCTQYCFVRNSVETVPKTCLENLKHTLD